MPNPEVKPARADGTAWGTCGRAGRRQIKFIYNEPIGVNPVGFFVIIYFYIDSHIM